MLNKPKLIRFVYLILFFVAVRIELLFSQDELRDDKALFEKVRHAYNVNLPARWIAFVQGKQLSQSLSKIPKDAYCLSNQTLSVLYLTVRNQGDLLIVQNVKNPYVMRFQNQLNLYQGVRFFVNFSGSFAELNERAVWKKIKQDKLHYIVKVRKRFLSEDRFFLLFFDSKQFLLRRIEQYQSGQKRASVVIEYQWMKPFWMLSNIHISDELSADTRTLQLSFSGYRFGDEIKPDWLIQLQNDCPKLN